ncbi:MAG TPA: diguanylate cyclase [Thermoanaerobaculia bacterium]
MPKDPLRRRSDSESADRAPLRALIVDDDADSRESIAAMLCRAGFAVSTSADGAEALRVLASSAPFHLLVVDCEMPRVSGLALISALRADERFRDVYAVMLTARSDADTKISALQRGFDDFVSKTAGTAEIEAKLSAARRLVLRHRRLDEEVRELYGLATRDELTGLFNRRFFFNEAERLLEEARVSLVFFDLDDFKYVNDNFGHLAGDRVLRDVGALFLSRTRHEDLVARYGGDEFIMLVQNLDVPDVEAIAARVAEEIAAQQWTFGTETLSVGVTTGIASSVLLEQPTMAQLLSAGDRDLYKNKWMRKHPELDPSVYEYDRHRDARILEMVPAANIPKSRTGE